MHALAHHGVAKYGFVALALISRAKWVELAENQKCQATELRCCGHGSTTGAGVVLFSMTGVAIWISTLAWGRYRRPLISLGFQTVFQSGFCGVKP
jgi:hypothetical protein